METNTQNEEIKETTEEISEETVEEESLEQETSKINKKYIIEKVKTHKKIICLIGSIFFNYIFPIIVVAIKFGLFEKETKTAYKITGISLLALVIIIIKFSAWINKFIKERIKKPLVKKIINVVKNIVLVVALIILIETMKDNLLSLEILAIILGVSFSLGNWLDEDYKECLEKDEKWKKKQETLNILREYDQEKENRK